MVLALTYFKCSVCGKEFNRFPSRNRGDAIYCSRQCFGLVHRGKNNLRYGIGPGKGHNVTIETRAKMSQVHKGYNHTEEAKEKIRIGHIGKEVSLETRFKMSETQKISQNIPELKAQKAEQQMGPRNNNWKGGTTKEAQRIKGTSKYREWREFVFRRDNFTCRVCGKRNGSHHPHHILPFAKYEELRLDVSNGVTLCVGCHKYLHSGGAVWPMLL